jgi:hypothetical protein
MDPNGRPPGSRLATALGVASIGLGVPQLAAPGRFARAVGVKPTKRARAITVAVGVREMAAAGGLLVLERPRPVASAGARVAGDALDAGLLASALARGAKEPERTRAAIAAVAGIAAADLVAAVRLARAPAPTVAIEAYVTTVKDRDEAERAWTASEEIAELRRVGDLDAAFSPAPGDRGTEIRVTLRAPVGAGPLRKAAGTHPRQQAFDRLRRFKQQLEAGEVARSDGAPEGHTATMQPKQRPAQPVEA